MHQEWYCTSNAIAQIMIVFLTSIYDELKTQILYLTDTMLASALHKVVTFPGEVLFERTSLPPPSRLEPSRMRLLATELIRACQTNLKNFNFRTRKRQPYFLFLV